MHLGVIEHVGLFEELGDLRLLERPVAIPREHLVNSRLRRAAVGDPHLELRHLMTVCDST